MQVNAKMIGAGVAAAVTAGLSYMLLARREAAAGFSTVTREGAFSVRDYPRLVVAETWAQGLRESALARGLETLADYVLGKDPLPATLPVLADGAEDGRGWRTRLVLPAHVAAEMLPPPRPGITLRSVPARRIAAVRFAGEGDERALDSHEAELRAWMAGRGLRAVGPVEHAFYNAPFTPRALRRNEVLIPLAA
jgi:hypothetical protein